MADMHHDWRAGSDPQHYVVRDIGISLDKGNGLQFGFLNDDRAKPLQRPIKDVVDDLLVTRQTEINPLAFLDRPETPLDLSIKGGSNRPALYIIFRIVSPPNMFFQPGRKAVSHKSGATPIERDRYGHLKHVAARGRHEREAEANCRIAYFGFRPGPTEQYEDGFNLRIRLIQQPHLPPSGANRILDIEIDPDIRFPGGSLVDPEEGP
jgi:hypothetical protein